MKKNLLPGWFPELSPLDQAIENQIKDIKYRKFGDEKGSKNEDSKNSHNVILI